MSSKPVVREFDLSVTADTDAFTAVTWDSKYDACSLTVQTSVDCFVYLIVTRDSTSKTIGLNQGVKIQADHAYDLGHRGLVNGDTVTVQFSETCTADTLTLSEVCSPPPPQGLGSPFETRALASLGWLSGIAGINKFGQNSAVNTAALPTDVWTQGGVYVPPTAARIHSVVSDNAADTSAGTGLRTVRVQGLDTNFDEISEDVTLNGATPVNTTLSFRRVNRMQGLTAGSGEVNAGTITATAATDGTVSATIEPGEGQTLQAIYTVPRNRKLFVVVANLSAYKSGPTAAAQSLVELRQRDGLEGSTPVLRSRGNYYLSLEGSSAVTRIFDPPKEFVGPCDVFFRVTAATDNNTSISAEFDGYLVTTA